MSEAEDFGPLTAGGMQETEGQRVPLRDEGEADETLLHLVGDTGEDLVPHDPVREVDRRNGNAARARKQAAKSPTVVENANGDIVRKADSLHVPEERRCTALTLAGHRCKVGKMRGLEVCIFHSHKALTDQSLATLADETTSPRLSPRRALKAVVALRAEELADAAVSGALSAEGSSRTNAVLKLIDSVDPLVATEEQVSFSPEGAEKATWRQLSAVFGT